MSLAVRRRTARLTKTWLCVVVVAGCADLPGGVTTDPSSQPPLSQPPPAPSPQAAATPERIGVSATVTPAPAGTSVSPGPTATQPGPTPTAPVATPTEPVPGTSPEPSDPPSPSQQERIEAEVVELTNAERSDAGCAPVEVDDRLTDAARAHSVDMVERGFFDHTNPDGDGPGERARAAGYDWRAISENIAWGQPTAEAVVAGWMDSPGHRRNILDCDVVEVGVGVAESDRGPYWTQLFGRR